MHKLIALAVLGCFAGAAAAASNVTLYGIVDQGVYVHKNAGGNTVTEMASGIIKGSRFGFKGTEDLGGGYKVYFVLEQGFDADTGEAKSSTSQFYRDSYVGLSTPVGSFNIGRTGALASGNNGGVLGQLSPFGITWKEAALTKVFAGNIAARIDNQIRFESVDLKGAKLYLQYSNGMSSDDAVASSQKDRYIAAGASYRIGGLRLVAVFDNIFYNDATYKNLKDQRTYNVGGSYEFARARVFAGYQHGENVRSARQGDLSVIKAAASKTSEGYTTDAVTAGVNIKVWGGELKGVLGYSHADRDYNGSKAQVYQAGIGYKYPLSKRTDLYAGAGFLRAKAELKGKETTGNSRSAFAGICHSF